MAKEYEIDIDSLERIYLNENGSDAYNRNLKVYFSTPKSNVNEDTGTMMYICGFGGNANSNVCKKMRNDFADKYNLITIQCDYFGCEFMQSADKIYVPDVNGILELDEFDRYMIYENNQFNFETFIRICISKSVDINLNYLYNSFENNCKIIAYHGITDDLISNVEKRNFCNKIKNCVYKEIDESKIDGKVFKSTDHGLGADFLELFDLTMRNLNVDFDKSTEFNLPREVVITTNSNTYIIDYEETLPKIYIK